MGLSLSHEQQQIFSTAREFAVETIAPHAAYREDARVSSRQLPAQRAERTKTRIGVRDDGVRVISARALPAGHS